MTHTDDISIHIATAEDFDEVAEVFYGAMFFSPTTNQYDRRLFEPERTLLARDGDTVVGCATAYTRD
ncbi:MAG: GNAT family N-acetyltransferase, partial [Stackebrandtia sp.]